MGASEDDGRHAGPGREAVLARLRALLPELRRRYDVERLALFGSTARAEAAAESDVDLLVSFRSPPSLFTLVELEDELARALGRRVDLVVRGTLKARIAPRVLREAVEV